MNRWIGMVVGAAVLVIAAIVALGTTAPVRDETPASPSTDDSPTSDRPADAQRSEAPPRESQHARADDPPSVPTPSLPPSASPPDPRAVLRDASADFIACAATAPTANTGPLPDHVTLEVEIDANGAVARATTIGELEEDSPVASCLRERARALQFAAHDREGTTLVQHLVPLRAGIAAPSVRISRRAN